LPLGKVDLEDCMMAATYQSGLDDAADLVDVLAQRWRNMASEAAVGMALAYDATARRLNGEVWLRCCAVSSELHQLARLIRGRGPDC
jgi:hypothetical protein